MVGAARALIAEPHLVRNAYEGKEERSRTCIACNWCMAALYEGAQTCTINPSAWRERFWGEDSFSPAPQRCKVVVVGSGPAGLEAARVAAERGHMVTLFEARQRCGGGLALWATLPGREDYAKGIDWWEKELKRLGVDVKLNTSATATSILAEHPDTVILATGARYSESGCSNHKDAPIPGHEQSFVHRPEEILLGDVNPSGKIVVLDGEGIHTAAGVAEVLAGRGAEVELLTPHYSPVSLRVIATQDAAFIMRRLHAAKVKISVNTYIKEIGEGRLVVSDIYSNEERVIEDVDSVVLSTGRVSVNSLEKELDGKVEQLFVVGDAAAARMWATASYEGHKFSRYVGELSAPKSIADVYFRKN